MSRLDRTRETIGYQKFWLGIMVVADISLMGWASSNFADASAYRTTAAVLAIVGLTVAGFLTHRGIEREISALEDL